MYLLLPCSFSLWGDVLWPSNEFWAWSFEKLIWMLMKMIGHWYVGQSLGKNPHLINSLKDQTELAFHIVLHSCLPYSWNLFRYVRVWETCDHSSNLKFSTGIFWELPPANFAIFYSWENGNLKDADDFSKVMKVFIAKPELYPGLLILTVVEDFYRAKNTLTLLLVFN